MKKLLFALCLFIASNTANAKVSCDDAGGIQRTGRSGNIEYCQSSQRMNWWTANAWCDAVGGTLFDIADCSLAVGGYTCPQVTLDLGFRYGWFWTKNVTGEKAVTLHIGDNSFTLRRKTEMNSAVAMCRLP